MDIEQYYDKIYRYIFFKVNNKALAEDLTQETFLRFLKAESREPERFLYTVARNLCIDEYRRIKPVSTDDEEVLNVSCEFEDDLVTKVSIRDALEKLDPEDREMVILRFVNEEPMGELCRIFDMSRFAVLRRLNRSKLVLKEFMERGSGNER